MKRAPRRAKASSIVVEAKNAKAIGSSLATLAEKRSRRFLSGLSVFCVPTLVEDVGRLTVLDRDRFGAVGR